VFAVGGAAAASPPRCTTAGLDVWLDSEGSGAAGTIFYSLEFTNLSGHACTLTGFPGVSAVSLTGAQLGSAARRAPIHPAKVVTLAAGSANNMAGDTASVLLGIVEAGNYSPSACHPVTAAGLRVYPPGQTTSEVVNYPFEACARQGPSSLHVAAIETGPNAAQ
jgi:hypothetical protein